MAEYQEEILEDDYPMYPDYWYIVDGIPIRNVFFSNISVGEYKKRTKAKEVKLCDFVKRRLI